MSKKIVVIVGALIEGVRTLELVSGAEGSSVTDFGINQNELPEEGFTEEGKSVELEMEDDQFYEIFYHATGDKIPSSETSENETATAAAEDGAGEEDAGDEDTAGQE